MFFYEPARWTTLELHTNHLRDTKNHHLFRTLLKTKHFYQTYPVILKKLKKKWKIGITFFPLWKNCLYEKVLWFEIFMNNVFGFWKKHF